MTQLQIKLPEHEPSIRASKANYEFNLDEPVWKLDNSISINWSLVSSQIDPKVKAGYLLTVARLAEEVSAAHARNCWLYIDLYFFRTSYYSGGEITDVELLNLKASLNPEDEYKLGKIRVLLQNWIDWGYEGLAPGLGRLLDSLILKGNIKGRAVLHQCPHTGPYTITEQQSLLVWAGNVFQKKELSLEKFTWFYLCFATARRSVQLRALRIGDIKSITKGNSVDYQINIPRAKQRGGGFRKQMRSLMITKDLYLVLLNQANSVGETIKQFISDITEDQISELPLFLCRRALDGVHTFSDYLARQSAQPDYFHITYNDASYLNSSISRACDAISERTSDSIHFTPSRCRRTRATNLVRHGISGVQLAYLMDHSDTQQLAVYTAYTPELAERIFKHMDGLMELLANKFAGRIIASDKDAKRADDPSSFLFSNGGDKVGACGGSPACRVGIKACIVCDLFQPFLYAPWQNLLFDLMEEMEHLKSKGTSELILQSYDLQLANVRGIMRACDEILNGVLMV